MRGALKKLLLRGFQLKLGLRSSNPESNDVKGKSCKVEISCAGARHTELQAIREQKPEKDARVVKFGEKRGFE